jgi:hypothetical protein
MEGKIQGQIENAYQPVQTQAQRQQEPKPALVQSSIYRQAVPVESPIQRQPESANAHTAHAIAKAHESPPKTVPSPPEHVERPQKAGARTRLQAASINMGEGQPEFKIEPVQRESEAQQAREQGWQEVRITPAWSQGKAKVEPESSPAD